jgi:hypothetical protein
MWIMVAGPYSSGARSESERLTKLSRLNQAAIKLFEVGHIPVIGVNMALPMIAVEGPYSFERLMMPISLWPWPSGPWPSGAMPVYGLVVLLEAQMKRPTCFVEPASLFTPTSIEYRRSGRLRSS